MNQIAFLDAHYNFSIVAASVFIAVLASYVTLDLSLRVRTASGGLNHIWWVAGSLVMGTGIWSMHFVGMMAFDLPIELGYTVLMTGLSWVAAVAAAAIALHMASEGRYSVRSLLSASLAMGLGITGMHYIGMAALDLTIPIVWAPRLVALSFAIAVVASAAALLIFRLLLRVSANRRLLTQSAAAVVMGAAICSMHYTGMAAAHFPAGTVCISANALAGDGLTAVLIVATSMLLLGALLASMLEARLQVIARRLAGSLKEANTQLESANEELTRRAFSDALTGLPNRRLFEERLTHAVQRLRRPGVPAEGRLAVFFIDLDGFKPVNDSFGHAAGDEVLKATASRLAGLVRSGDTVARIGGDEFLVLLDELADRAACERFAGRILEAIAEPFVVAGQAVKIACSIGVATMERSAEDVRLITNADAAMYAAKRVGGAGFALFEDGMVVDAALQLTLQSDLRGALDHGQFELYYQPKIDARKNVVTGVEALVRWNHPTRGVVGPQEFIPTAERSGLIVRLGRWVLDEACRQIADWQSQGRDLNVAVNLSVIQLADASLLDDVRESLARHNVPASRLLCEVTESLLLENTQATARTLVGLRALGVHLSVDDFGTGYSNLSQLKDLPARQLKIDRTFIQELETRSEARAVVASVIQLAHALHLTVVAEGVETAGQRDLLKAMGCDELQGYFYARPMQAAMMQSWSIDAPASHSRTLVAPPLAAPA